MRIHANRLKEHVMTVEQKFDTFKLYMAYAIGGTSLKLTERYDSTPPEVSSRSSPDGQRLH